MTRRAKWTACLVIGVAIFSCCAFAFFYVRAQRRSQALSGKALPEANLVDLSGTKLSDKELREGKVVLIFVTPECNSCLEEGNFLKTVMDKRSDIKFYGVISFGDRTAALQAAAKEFAFKAFYDDGFRLAGRLGIYRVPIKIYLENGIMKKAWGGATTDEHAKAAFVKWMDNLR